jgi:hypothetical protein
MLQLQYYNYNVTTTAFTSTKKKQKMFEKRWNVDKTTQQRRRYGGIKTHCIDNENVK